MIERLISTAKSEIGYLEKASNAKLDDKTANAGHKNWTKYGRDYDKLMGTRLNGQPWCAMYASIMFVDCFGFDTAKAMIGGNLFASCNAWINALRARGQWIERTMVAKPGDIVFFADAKGTAVHVGLVTAVGSRIQTIEGNTSSTSGVVPNGGAVCAKSYAYNYGRIYGYGRPKYDLVEDDMTQAEFNKMMDAWMADQAKKPLPDWAKAEFAEAIKLGITDGANPMQLIPRYQAAIMAKRIKR